MSQPTPDASLGSLLAPLSQAFVAFTIEADNEFESRMPHRTAADRGNPNVTGPFLTSLTFWSNYLRHIPNDGCSARYLAQVAGDQAPAIKSRLGELHRWSYIRVGAAGADPGERRITLTPNGRRARDVWEPIEQQVEERWVERFGGETIDALWSALASLPVGDGLPLGFPILAWDRARALRPAEPVGAGGLSTALVRAILAMAIDFDATSTLSLSMTQLLMPHLDCPIPIRDLPRLTGVSKEAIAIAVGRLTRSGLATMPASPKVLSLTREGMAAAADARERLYALEAKWAALSDLPAVLASIVTPRLAEGLRPPASGWRSRAPYLAQTTAVLADPAAALPRFPMVSHRAGYPDGN